MRTKPLLGERVWFGPRLLGWGWTPVSWEGWTVSLAAVAVLVAAEALYDGSASLTAQVLVIAALFAVGVLKGTGPGGPAARREFRQRGRGH